MKHTNHQPRPQGFSLKKWVGKTLGTRLHQPSHILLNILRGYMTVKVKLWIVFTNWRPKMIFFLFISHILTVICFPAEV